MDPRKCAFSGMISPLPSPLPDIWQAPTLAFREAVKTWPFSLGIWGQLNGAHFGCVMVLVTFLN